MLIRAYRVNGHLIGNLDPLRISPVRPHPELDPASYGFTPADLDHQIYIDNVLGLETASLRQIIEILRRTYCGTIGFEFMHISVAGAEAWIQERVEGPDKEVSSPAQEGAILTKLSRLKASRNFSTRNIPAPSVSGSKAAEALIPALEQIIKRGGQLGVKEIVIGMPHRGRLNVLTNVMGKPHRALFHEFKGGSANPEDVEGSGDVKYHLGASSIANSTAIMVHLSLTANPSHLEIVDPGRARQSARQAGSAGATTGRAHHGDAAADPRRRRLRRPGRGRGMLRPVRLAGHRTGGSVHFIVNNQIGFTTSPALFALFALSVRHRQDDRGADLPRQRRRSRSRGLRRQGRDRIPAEVPEAGRHRHVLLPPPRPQRRRRAVLHPAADVQGDRRRSRPRSRSIPSGWSARAWSPRAKSTR